MTQEIINKYFNSEIGKQYFELFTTSDDQIHIRLEDAEFHAAINLENQEVERWEKYEFPEEFLVESKSEELFPEEYLDTTLHDLEYVGASLALASEHKLTTEVVYAALMYMKQFPSSSIEECMDAAVNEWIK